MYKRFKTDLNTDIEFMKTLYKTRKENLKTIMESVSSFNYIKYDDIIIEIKEQILNTENEFSFFNEKFKQEITQRFNINEIWRWCLLNASLQFNFLDNQFRLRNVNSKTINEILMDDILIVKSERTILNIINDLDISKKAERKKIIKKLFNNFNIRNEVFTDDPLFKKGFLAGMFYNDITNTNTFTGGPCVDYHLITYFTNKYPNLSNDIFELRMQIWFILDQVHKKTSINFNKIDNKIFAIAREFNQKNTKSIKLITIDTTWF